MNTSRASGLAIFVKIAFPLLLDARIKQPGELFMKGESAMKLGVIGFVSWHRVCSFGRA